MECDYIYLIFPLQPPPDIPLASLSQIHVFPLFDNPLSQLVLLLYAWEPTSGNMLQRKWFSHPQTASKG